MRDIDSATGGRLADNVPYIYLVRLDFPKPVYVHSRTGEYSFDGNTYRGLGVFGSISSVADDTQINPQRVSLTLSNIDSDFSEYILKEAQQYQNRDVYIYFALLDENSDIIGQPITIFRGKSGNASFEAGNKSAFVLEVYNQFAPWSKAARLRHTDTVQRSLYDDTALQYVQDTLEPLTWRASNADV